MTSGRRVWIYWGVVGLFALVLVWWLIFFSRQGEIMVERLEAQGAGLTDAQATAVAAEVLRSARMLLFEGAFLVLLLGAGVWLTIRSMRQEVELHRQRRAFLSAVTHELKSPIASARLYIESLEMGRVPEGKTAHYLARVREELDRLTEMADHLLAAARASSQPELSVERLESLDLGEFTRAAVARIQADELPRLAVEVASSPAPVRVRADRAALTTILRNLLTNADKYGGAPGAPARVEVRVFDGDGRAHLEVRDHGPGFQHEAGKEIFDPFVRGGDELVRRRPGVGLGLYLVAELVRAQGGEVEARNAEQGFSVEVSLPQAGVES